MLGVGDLSLHEQSYVIFLHNAATLGLACIKHDFFTAFIDDYENNYYDNNDSSWLLASIFYVSNTELSAFYTVLLKSYSNQIHWHCECINDVYKEVK